MIGKGEEYYWLDQSKVPLGSIKSITVIENYTEKQESLLRKLDDLQREKDSLVKQQQQAMVIGTPRSQ